MSPFTDRCRLVTQRGRRDWFRAAAGRFQPLREHLTSSHRKWPLIAFPIVGDGLRRAFRRSTSSFQLWHAKSRPIVDALSSRGWVETWPDQPENQLAEASAMLRQWE